MFISTLSRQWRILYIAFAFGSAALFEYLVADKYLGLGFFLLVLVYSGGFVALAAKTKQIHQRWALLLLIPTFILAFDVMLYNNEFVQERVPWIVAAMLFVFSLLLTLKNTKKLSFDASRIPFFETVMPIQRIIKNIITDLFSSREEKRNEAMKKTGLALLISVPILFVFATLFANADAVFAEMLHNFFDISLSEKTVLSIVRILAIAGLLSVLFYIFIDEKYDLREHVIKIVRLDSFIVSIILGLVNALFALFVFVQINYLFGTRNFVLDTGITFAEYARSGFFQLVWVIVLAALMLIIFYRSSVHHGSNALLKTLKILLIVQVGIIAISALKRMNLYQSEYGYTVLRLYVEWFIYFSMCILFLSAISIGIDWKFSKFLYTTFALGFVALAIVGSLNVDRIIARENVDRYIEEGKELDMGYLVYILSSDAALEVKRAFEAGYIHETRSSDDLTYDKTNFELLYVQQKYTHLHTHIKSYKVRHFVDIMQGWREYNIGIEKLKRL